MKTSVKVSLAIHGGEPAVTLPHRDTGKRPALTREAEEAVLDVLRANAMSGTEITRKFEREFADWIGVEYALGYCNGTASLLGAMWACGLRAGDEIIGPSITYWASAAPALSLGAAVHFADIDPDTLCIDPKDIEHRIGPRTKAIMVVHAYGRPCAMDEIMAIARRHKLKVIEDVSHAHGALYKGRPCGSIGDVGCFSLMAGKSLPCGEAGMMVTNDREIYERCIAFGHHERTGVETQYNPVDNQITSRELARFAGKPLFGCKHRMNQTCSALGRVQLRLYPEHMAETDRAMNRFWDLLDGVPGIHPTRPPKDSQTTMGGWYVSRGLYRADELGGLSCQRFCEAVKAEGVGAAPGTNSPLHLHPLFHEADLFGLGQPTMIAFGQRDVRQGPGSLPVSESHREIAFRPPWLRRDYPDLIGQYAAAYRKVAENADQLTGEA